MRKRLYTPLVDFTGSHENETGDQEFFSDGTPIPKCHNIVSTSQIVSSCGSIDLQRIASLLPNSRYDRKRFAAITIRVANPDCTGLLFGSGKLVITGSVSIFACMLAAHNISDMLRRCHPHVDFKIQACVIQNIVAHVEIPKHQRFDVNTFYRNYCEFTTYQKNVFPGLVFRPPQSPVVLLLFASGKIVCTGGKTCDDILNGFKKLYPSLRPYIIKRTDFVDDVSNEVGLCCVYCIILYSDR